MGILNAQRLQRLSVDGLTQVASRGATEEFLENQLTLHPDRSVAVLVMDLDHFKEVNDLGTGPEGEKHLAGDAALQEAARRLKSVMPEGSLLGRWGGDEFVAVLPDTDDLGARAMAERLRQGITQEPVRGKDTPFHLDLSVGHSVGGGWSGPTTAQALFNEADGRMYAVKQQHHAGPSAEGGSQLAFTF